MSDDVVNSEAFQELVMGERKFLHDVSNQLVIAQGMGSFIMKSLKKRDEISEKELDRMEKTMGAVKNIVKMVQERRMRLHSLTAEEEES